MLGAPVCGDGEMQALSYLLDWVGMAGKCRNWLTGWDDLILSGKQLHRVSQ